MLRPVYVTLATLALIAEESAGTSPDSLRGRRMLEEYRRFEEDYPESDRLDVAHVRIARWKQVAVVLIAVHFAIKAYGEINGQENQLKFSPSTYFICITNSISINFIWSMIFLYLTKNELLNFVI